MVIAPFPYADLDVVTRSEARATRAIRAHVDRAVDLASLRRAFVDLGLGSAIEILPRRVRKATQPRGADDFVGVALAHGEDATLAGAWLLEVSGALAAALVRRALKRPAPRVHDAARPAPAELLGSFAALVVAVGRRAHAGGPLRVVSVGPGAGLFADLLRASGGDCYSLSFAVVLDGAAYEARVTMPRALVDMSPHAPFDRDVLLSLGATPLCLPVVLARVIAPAREIAELSRGDALMLGDAGLALGEGRAPKGAVQLIAPRGELALSATIAGLSELVFGGELESSTWSRETEKMEDSGKASTALADAPLVLRVEVGAAEMPAREWASLKKGDIISLKKRLGEPVVLRVSGVEVARGELVQIDGEVGVRILERVQP